MEDSHLPQAKASKPVGIWQAYHVPILLGGASVLCIAVSLILLVTAVQSTKPIEFGRIDVKGETSHNIDPLLQHPAGSSQNGSDSLLQHPDGSSQNEPTGSDPSLISINNASHIELEFLPGVGPVTAQKIIDHRPYETLEDLVTKKAVGQKLFEKIKDFLVL